MRTNRIALVHGVLLASLGLCGLGLAGCSGDEGKQAERPTTPDGEFPPQPGTGANIPVTAATQIVSSIQRVTVPDDGKPEVEVYLKDDRNFSLTGLPADSIRFVLARLEPAQNGASSTWHAITRRIEEFPGTPAPDPADAVTGTGPASQGYTETATSGVWTEKGNGVYTYKFAQGLEDDPAIPFDGSLPHRVGLEIRLGSPPVPANNAVMTFNPVTGTPIAQSGREIVDNDTCNACHDNLVVHGGARFDLPYCVMCHDAFSVDAQTGNTLDFKVLIHRIHSGETLPSVEAGGHYGIFGNRNSWNDYSEVVFPQDTRNCTTCHEESDADTPQADNWRLTVNRASCGSCHDNVNFATGANHGGIAATDDTCTACHGANADILGVAQAHQIPEQVAAAKFKYEVLGITGTAPGEFPTVTIRVVDPTNGNVPYDIKAANGPFQNASGTLVVDVAFSTRPDFTNTGSGSATATTGAPAQPIRVDFKANGVADPTIPGAFKATSAVAIPAGATGSGSALLEGHPGVNVDDDADLETVPVPSVGINFAITDAAPVEYRPIVELAKCNDCHEQLALHGNNRVDNVELCATCHNPNATDVSRRVAGSECVTDLGTDDQAIDLKFMVHAIHAGVSMGGAGYTVCGFGNTAHDFSTVKYPGMLENCEGCHLPGTYYPPDSTTAIATTIDAGADRSTPADDVAITPASAACSSCHTSDTARQHMQLNGGSFDAVKAADSTTPGAPTETCGDCHGEGEAADVKVEHGVDEFRYNE
ncbi:MAG TPA: OmcA/MtrC family decaheme c-type cytochrome [Steroidobacteraceae bacterium]|nr:OmcA/MtrC family decaheme c-type cytochrome [Steroidobacteraceae bacterium]